MVVNMQNTICFTGRRPKDLFGYEKDNYLPLYNTIKTIIKDIFIPAGYTKYISGGAQGFDQLAFWAVNALKTEGYNIKNVVYVPFKGQELNWAKAGLFSQEEYNLMLSLADEVNILQQINRNSKVMVNQALLYRNHAMVNDSYAVFGLYPNDSWKSPVTKGGTAECLRYTLSQNKPILRLSPETLTINWTITNI